MEMKGTILAEQTPAPNLGNLLERLEEVKRGRISLEAQATAAKKEEEALGEQVMGLMTKLGLQKAGNGEFNVMITSRSYPRIIDYEAFCRFVQEKGYWHLFERRVSVTGARELFDLDGPDSIPGVERSDKLVLKEV